MGIFIAMKLIKILQEITIKPQNSIEYRPDPGSLTPPDDNDTFKSWLEKNNNGIRYSDKRKGKDIWSIKAVVFYGLKGIDKWIKNPDTGVFTPNPRYIEQLNLFKPYIKRRWQSYMDQICGPNRVKVSVQDNIRFIINQRPSEFKMKQP